MTANIKAPIEAFIYDSLVDYRQGVEGKIISKAMWLETVRRAHEAWHESRKPIRRKPIADPEAWLASIRKDPAMYGVDIDKEIAKCKFWCANQPIPLVASRQRIINWLNKADRKVGVVAPSKPAGTPEPAGYVEWFMVTREAEAAPAWSSLDEVQRNYLLKDMLAHP